MYRQIKLSLIFAAIWFTNPVVAHQMVPSHVYPEWYGDTVERVSLTITNMRDDVRFYKVGVYDDTFNPVVFATSEKLIELKHLERRRFEVYLRKGSSPKPRYVCTESKLIGNSSARTMVASRVCSKIQD